MIEFGKWREAGAIRLLLPLIGLVSLALLAVFGTLMLATRELDRTVMESSRHLVHTALRNSKREISVQAQDLAFWDAVIANVVETVNRDWISDNVGQYAFDTFDFDMLLVLDDTDRVLVFEHKDAVRPVDLDHDDLRAILASLIERARAAPMDRPAGVGDLVRIGNRVFVTGLAAVTPESPTEEQLQRAPRPILAYFRELGPDRLERIGADFGIPDFHWSRPSEDGHADAGEGRLLVRGDDGASIGEIHWQLDRTTSQFLHMISMPFLLASVVMLALAAWLVAATLRGQAELRRRADALVDANARLVESEAQARSALQQAEHATRAKSGFLANVSHELRTPLTAIIGFSQILKMRRKPGAAASREDEYATIIHDSSQHLLNLVNDILDLAKIESGGYELNETWLDLNGEAAAVRTLFSAEAVRRSIDLDLIGLEGAPAVRADARAVKQILTNLISNALKFTPSGGRADLRVVRRRGRVGLEVEDTGSGIPEKDQETIWHPFSRSSDPSVSKTEGSGLGLQLVKILGDLHDCEIELDSVAGRGTRVTVLFPDERTRPAA